MAKVTLSFPQPLTPDIAAMLRLGGDGPAAARIKARFALWDAGMLGLAKDCDTDPPGRMVRQDVGVAFAGPR